MAYLAQLKTKSKNNYEAVRRLIIYQDPRKENVEGTQDREVVQKSLAQLISMHRECNHEISEIYCSHMQDLVNSITKLLA